MRHELISSLLALMLTACQGPARPQLIAPLSGSVVDGARTILRWKTDSAHSRVQVCAERNCESVLTSVETMGKQLALPDTGSARVVFWRVASVVGGNSTYSAVWELAKSSVPSIGPIAFVADIDGDGLQDFAVGHAEMESTTLVSIVSDKAIISTLEPTAVEKGQFGAQLAVAGDVNGDGFSDLIVGAPCASQPAPRVCGTGMAVIVLGGPQKRRVDLRRPEAPAAFGSAVSGVGDLDGDGFGDVAVGSPVENLVVVYYGSADGIGQRSQVIKSPVDAPTRFGSLIRGGQDLNSDGFSDLVVAGQCFSSGGCESGNVFVYFGGSTGLSKPVILRGDSPVDGFGVGLGIADVTGDGRPELLVGAPCTPGMEPFTCTSGAVLAFDVSSGTAKKILTIPRPDNGGGGFGASIGTGGDFDGDGVGDLAVGANGSNVYVFYGPSYGRIQIISKNPALNLVFGEFLLAPNDFDANGFSDLVVSARPGPMGAANVETYFGSSAGLSIPAAISLPFGAVSALSEQ